MGLGLGGFGGPGAMGLGGLGMGMGMGMPGMMPYGMGMGMPGMNPYGMGMPGGGTKPAGEPGNPVGMNPYGNPMMGNPMMMGGMYGMGGMMMGDTNNVKVVGSKDKPLKVVCKAIDMRDVDPTANNRLITELVQQVKNKGLFDYNETKPRELDETERMELADIRDEKSEEEGKARLKTYLFGLNLVLREPIEL